MQPYPGAGTADRGAEDDRRDPPGAAQGLTGSARHAAPGCPAWEEGVMADHADLMLTRGSVYTVDVAASARRRYRPEPDSAPVAGGRVSREERRRRAR